MNGRQKGFCHYLPSNKKNPIQKNSVTSSIAKETKHFITSESVCHTHSQKDSHEKKSSEKRIDWYAHTDESKKPSVDSSKYNILHIDSKIREILSSNISSLPELQGCLQKVLWIYHTKNLKKE